MERSTSPNPDRKGRLPVDNTIIGENVCDVEPREAVGVGIDWIAFTVTADNRENILTLLNPRDLKILDHGQHNFDNAGHSPDGISVYWGGEQTRNKTGQETAHFVVSGSGCGYLAETLFSRGDGYGWGTLFRDLILLFGATFTRVDVCFDDRSGLIDIDRCRDEWIAGNVTSRYETAQLYAQMEVGRGAIANAITWGSRSSDTYLRLYNKQMERIAKGQDDPGVWNRFEMEFKRKRAQAVARRIANDGGMSQLVGVLRSYIDFKQPGGAEQKTRWLMASWWAAFVAGAEKARLHIDTVKKTVQTVSAWLRRQVSTGLALLINAQGGIGDKRAAKYIRDMYLDGSKRMGKRHHDMLKEYLDMIEEMQRMGERKVLTT